LSHWRDDGGERRQQFRQCQEQNPEQHVAEATFAQRPAGQRQAVAQSDIAAPMSQPDWVGGLTGAPSGRRPSWYGPTPGPGDAPLRPSPLRSRPWSRRRVAQPAPRALQNTARSSRFAPPPARLPSSPRC
jgi:hypothetical protein